MQNRLKKAFKRRDPDNLSKVLFVPIRWTMGLKICQGKEINY